MDTTAPTMLTAQTTVNAPIELVWKLWGTPADIMRWNNMGPDWHTTKVENDLHTGGKYSFIMALKDGSFSFDYAGTYTEVIPHQLIANTLNDGRKTTITFTKGSPVTITETFEATNTEPAEMQQCFCQAVLDSFKAYTEAKI